ncbi:hypothetical protein SDRG_04163 [Saprolegnia diclina VS20]|uniref:SH2 domain-containing protein n=1 Tax=Saprolegnia diclina (strain VS20) TaxID=1156394 RepID=T0QWT1_SAPDV|nr:hypothetical protein SDRG_04163 [Saprolegnia diclina VS20]EQC38455.1 hypothetical protein SDRG_04163 [Saprolegnia diclina VS20]|eukprot:XP_008608047.1 hypothetical protein SDRG_04163 [Saprolegnia diclina VS20]
MPSSEDENSPAVSESESESEMKADPGSKKRKLDKKGKTKAAKKSRVMDSDDEKPRKKNAFVEEEASESDDDGKEIDSSEEEDVEEDNTYVNDGFVVGDDDESDEDEGRGHRKRKKKKDKKRSRLRQGRDDDDLDDDDIDLIQENLGIKKNRDRSYSDGGDFDSDGSAKKASKKVKKKAEKINADMSKDMFGASDDDEDAAPVRKGDGYGDEAEYDSDDGFIVSEDEDGNGRQKTGHRPVKKPRQSMEIAQGPSLYQLDEAEELFGDAEAFLEATRGHITQESAEKDKRAILIDKYEPSVLKEFHMTANDAAVRERDEPERYIQMFAQRRFPDPEERAEEAEWMVDSVLKKLEAKYTGQRGVRGNLVTAIDNVLRFYHEDKLEPAFVQRYCKEYWKTAGLHSEHLYLIQDLDIKYDKLQRKRAALQVGMQNAVDASEARESTAVRKCYQHVVRSPEEKHLADLSLAFSTLDVREKSNAAGLKRPGRRTFYNVCVKAGLKGLAAQFTMSATVLGGVLAGILTDGEGQVETPTASLGDICMTYLSNEFPTIPDVLKGARHVAAYQVASDPNVRQRMRDLFHRFASLTTVTTKKGVEEIDEFHYCHGLQYLEGMAALDVFGTDLYMRVEKAEKEGFVTAHVSVDHLVLIESLEQIYLAPGDSSEWQSHRRDILAEAVVAFLIPSLQEELRQEWRLSAQDVVLRRCGDAMRKRVMVRPFEAHEGEDPRLIGIYVDDEDPEAVAYIVALDENGELVDKVQGRCLTATCLESLQTVLTTFLEEHTRTSAVVINTSGGLKCMDMGELVDSVRNKIHRADASEPREYLHVTFLKDDVARMYSKSKRAEAEFPEESTGMRAAIGLARYLRNPLAELSSMWGFVAQNEPGRGRELLYLNVDLFQSHVNKDLLVKEYERIFTQTVNKVGVDINYVANYAHASYVLQFVSGLGPIKALALIEKIKAAGYLEKRQDLLKMVSGAVVYRNCAGFVRIRERDALKESPLNSLDDTRIHPESYYMAVKMCGDANNNTTMDLYDPDQYSYAVEDTMFQSATAIKNASAKRPASTSKKSERLSDVEIQDSLADLDLPAYANRLELQQKGPKLLTLEHIKRELRYPYFDPRDKYKDPVQLDLFYLLHNETRETLRIGMVVPCRLIKMAGDQMVVVSLHSNIKAQLKKEHLPDYMTERGNEYLRINGFPRGMQVNAKIMDFVQDYNRYHLSLACDQRSIVMMTEEIFNRGSFPRAVNVDKIIKDSQHRYDLLVNELPRPEEEKSYDNTRIQKKSQRKRRQIIHPVFHNVNMKQAIAKLKTLPVGDVVLRPARENVDHLTLTWKVLDGVYRHFDVLEKDKPSEGRLGAKLIVKDETFESIDEMIARLIDPMNTLVDEIVHHKNYRNEDAHDIGEALLAEKKADPKRIPYAIHPFKEYPGCFSVTFVARTTARTWNMEVRANGFRFFGSVNSSVQPSLAHALAFFKKTALAPPKSKPRTSNYASGSGSRTAEPSRPSSYSSSGRSGEPAPRTSSYSSGHHSSHGASSYQPHGGNSGGPRYADYGRPPPPAHHQAPPHHHHAGAPYQERRY